MSKDFQGYDNECYYGLMIFDGREDYYLIDTEYPLHYINIPSRMVWSAKEYGLMDTVFGEWDLTPTFPLVMFDTIEEAKLLFGSIMLESCKRGKEYPLYKSNRAIKRFHDIHTNNLFFMSIKEKIMIFKFYIFSCNSVEFIYYKDSDFIPIRLTET